MGLAGVRGAARRGPPLRVALPLVIALLMIAGLAGF